MQEYERLTRLNVSEFQRFCDAIGDKATQAGLTEDRLQSALSYLHESGKLLYFEDSLTLKEYVFHNLPRFIAILNVFFQRDAATMLERLLAEADGEDRVRASQMKHLAEGFLHRMQPGHFLRLLLLGRH